MLQFVRCFKNKCDKGEKGNMFRKIKESVILLFVMGMLCAFVSACTIEQSIEDSEGMQNTQLYSQETLVDTEMLEVYAQEQKKEILIAEQYLQDKKVCKRLGIVQYDAENDLRKFLVEMEDGRTFYIDIPQGEYPEEFTELLYADLDGDGTEEMICICWQSNYYAGIYIVNVEQKELMTMPHMNDDGLNEGAVGSSYDFFVEDEEHVQIKGMDYEEIIELTYDEILKARYTTEYYNKMSEEEKEEYLKPYKVDKGSWVGYALETGYDYVEVVEYNNKVCLQLRQPCVGAWGRADSLSVFVDTVVSWNKKGDYQVEKVNVIKDIK